MSNVINFISHFEKKQHKQRLAEELNASGWEITDEIGNLESEVCVYLMDTKEACVILFGTDLASIPVTSDNDSINWQNFVLAWDVIADPEMPFDETHKQSTISMSLKALSGIEDWETFRGRLAGAKDTKKPHLLVLIDRDNSQSPRELIVAYSESNVLNADSLHAIMNSYVTD